MLDRSRGYVQACNPKPSAELVKKLRKLGWKPGQLIYWDREHLEMRFFDDRMELDRFLEKRLLTDQRPHRRKDPNWDSIADIERKMDEYERRALR